jgi:hypothetical protein
MLAVIVADVLPAARLLEDGPARTINQFDLSQALVRHRKPFPSLSAGI